MKTIPRKSVCLVAAMILATGWGCAAKVKPAADLSQRQRQVNEGYTLLYELVRQNSRVGGVLILKSASPETRVLINDIAAACAEAVKQLDRFAKDDPALRFDAKAIPAVEQATRDAIESATTKALLSTRAEVFEVRLLLAQADATSYAAYLAWTLHNFDDNAERSARLEELSVRFNQLNNRVGERLTIKQSPVSHEGQGTSSP